MQNDEQAIRDLIASWLLVTADGDLNRVVSLMAEDVVFLVSGQPPMTDKSAFAESFKAAAAKFHLETTSHIREICVSGELAYRLCECVGNEDMVVLVNGSGTRDRPTGPCIFRQFAPSSNTFQSSTVAALSSRRHGQSTHLEV